MSKINSELNSNTYSFLFTDIEGSTRMWESQPDAMQEALARHDEILRDAVESNGGRVVKTTGDGCHAAFGAALKGVNAALAAQLALEAIKWNEALRPGIRVRMGLHTGQAEERAGDYFGPALNRAARLMAVGYGRQILLSAATAELVRDQLPTGTSLVDLGMHRLKDLTRPEHVFQVVHPSLTAEFPLLRSLDAYPNNLPLQLTAFIGRERELNETRVILKSARLLTLTGSGGTGKTRLSLQLAADLLHIFADGGWQVELAPVTEPELVIQAIAEAFGLEDVQGIPRIDQVTNYLRSKSLLLVLDNCEQVVEAVAKLAGHLLKTCPELKLIATSREALGINGETVYHVPSLSVPEADQVTVSSMLDSEAVQLFIEIATMAKSHFTLTDNDAPSVAQICQRLDGIPLALELAAARIRVFSPEQIAARLDDRFHLLTGGSRTALPRQQTLRAMIDWSYDLLSEDEKKLLRRLAVFTGGWTFEAAEGVCPEFDVLNLLTQLVNKSLVIVDEQPGQTRYRLLETIRQYALDKLGELSEEAEARKCHLDYFTQLAVEAEPHFRNADIQTWQELLELEADNIRVAMEWGLEHDPEQFLNLVGSLALFEGSRVFIGQTRSWVREAIGRIDTLLPVSGDALLRRERMKAKGWLSAGMLAFNWGEIPASRAALSESITQARKIGDKFTLAIALSMRGLTAQFANDEPAARKDAEEGIALFLDSDDKWGAAMGMLVLSWAEDRQGNQIGRDKLLDEVQQLIQGMSHPLLHYLLMGAATEARGRRDFVLAGSLLEESLQLTKHWRSQHTQLAVESEIAHIARQSGDLKSAKQAYRKTILKWKETGHRAAIAHQLECLAFIARSENQKERAAQLMGAAEALREAINSPMTGVERTEYDNEISALREQLSGEAFDKEWAKGRFMTMDQAIELALNEIVQAPNLET